MRSLRLVPSAKDSVVIVVGREDVRAALAEGLKFPGAQVLFANDAAEARSIASQLGAQVLIADLAAGLGLWREAELSSSAAVLLTRGELDETVEALDAGADCVKPCTAAELCARVRAALRMKTRNDSLTQSAQTDALTGLGNRAAFDRKLAEEIAFAARSGRTVSVVMVDVDHFKRINDQFGHPCGDRVLRAVADVLRSTLRQGESAFRYGGEEFAIVVRDGDAMAMANRARAAVAAIRMGSIVVTASFGVAGSFSPVASGASHLIEAADRALYTAKHSGRNCVRLAVDGAERRVG